MATSDIIILDGGMGHLLRRKGIEVKGELGSSERFLGVAMANIEQPSIVQEAHEEYLKAGAQVITTNSYACVPSIVGNDERTIEVIRAAGKIARAAADKYPGAMVAGSLPPLHESYRPDRVGSDAENIKEYRLIAEAIAPFSDVLLCETMSCAREAAAAAKAASVTGKPVWVSWALSDDSSGNLVSGETVEEAVKVLDLKKGGPVAACLFNCSLPECVDLALPKLQKLVPKGIATGAYANGFCGGGISEYRADLTPQMYAHRCQQWARGGSRILGGCCGVFPEHIVAMCSTCISEHGVRGA
eukprot:TRINITY_DN1444_c0_g1_i1.p1 TRINITY_DN1444_c0_g1~~TRINITY_DN1444_c0_g1_i1.p1  ORF type:complete len:332 (+),score=43.03 TRINITY_DN1444_c0_g1_i1:94-996(+)